MAVSCLLDLSLLSVCLWVVILWLVTKYRRTHLFYVYKRNSIQIGNMSCFNQHPWMHLNLNTNLYTYGRSPIFCHESWQSDISSFRVMNVALTVSFKLISFNIYIRICLKIGDKTMHWAQVVEPWTYRIAKWPVRRWCDRCLRDCTAIQYNESSRFYCRRRTSHTWRTRHLHPSVLSRSLAHPQQLYSDAQATHLHVTCIFISCFDN